MHEVCLLVITPVQMQCSLPHHHSVVIKLRHQLGSHENPVPYLQKWEPPIEHVFYFTVIAAHQGGTPKNNCIVQSFVMKTLIPAPPENF